MKKLHTLPAADGFRMPGEFEPHRGCIMIWPKRPGSWNYGAKKAREAFKRVAWAIAESEEVFMLAEADVEENAREMLTGNPGHEIHVIRMESDDAWARDVAPTFVVNDEKNVRGIDWEFNAWGGDVDGLYAHWEKVIRLRRRSARNSIMTAMRRIRLFWKAARSIRTVRERSS